MPGMQSDAEPRKKRASHDALSALGGFFVIVLVCTIPWLVVAQQRAPQKLTVEMVRLMDVDRDGRITRDEFDRVSGDASLFERVDANGDGILDAGEIRANLRVRARIVN